MGGPIPGRIMFPGKGPGTCIGGIPGLTRGGLGRSCGGGSPLGGISLEGGG